MSQPTPAGVRTPTRQARRLPRAVREQQMLDAAVTVFSRRGYHTASMDEIAELAGISKPMVYAYLGAKEGLFSACIQREATRLVSAIADGVEPGLPPDEQLWRGLRAFFTHVGANRHAWAVLYVQARAEPRFAGELAQLRERVIGVVAGLLGEAVRRARTTSGGRRPRAAEVTAMAYALVGAGESLAGWLVEHVDEAPETPAARLMNFAWLGFANLLSGEAWHPAPDPDPPLASSGN